MIGSDVTLSEDPVGRWSRFISHGKELGLPYYQLYYKYRQVEVLLCYLTTFIQSNILYSMK
jgi:hypothetical protein